MLRVQNIWFLFFLTANSVWALDGPNTCIEEKEVPSVVKVPSKVPQETKTFKWCLSKWPPRCETTKLVYVEGYKQEIIHQKTQIRVCCKGYAEVRNKCIPVCSSPCPHGRCIAPEKCECKPGWKGQYCQTECLRSDNECVQGCNCDHGGICNVTTGVCKCPPGYTGDYCSDQCPLGTFGLNCSLRCECDFRDSGSEDHVVCDHISGCKIWSSASLKVFDANEAALGNSSSALSATHILLIGMMIIVLLIFGFTIMKYRRDLRLLNSELAFVTYISRKESNDRFDNPLYSYQATDYKPPLSPSGQSPSSQPSQQQSSSPPSSTSFLSTKAAFLNGFKRGPELVSSTSSSSCMQVANEKLLGLPNDFLKPLNSTSCYEDLKTAKREYNTNIYEDGDNCTSKFLSTPLQPPPSPSTSAKEPVYAEIPASGTFSFPTTNKNSDDEDLKENQYDVPRPINSPNNQQQQDNKKLDESNCD